MYLLVCTGMSDLWLLESDTEDITFFFLKKKKLQSLKTELKSNKKLSKVTE